MYVNSGTRVRNGMYHLGYTKSHLYIHNAPQDFPSDFTTRMQGGERFYFVNPHAMTRTIVAHFPSLMTRLRDSDPEFDQLRDEFRDFYVTFHQGTEREMPER